MKKYLTLLFLTLSVMSSYAYDVEIDGIYYNLVPKAKQAQVTNNGYGSYSGDIVIPEKIISSKFASRKVFQPIEEPCLHVPLIFSPGEPTTPATMIMSVYRPLLASEIGIAMWSYEDLMIESQSTTD